MTQTAHFLLLNPSGCERSSMRIIPSILTLTLLLGPASGQSLNTDIAERRPATNDNFLQAKEQLISVLPGRSMSVFGTSRFGLQGGQFMIGNDYKEIPRFESDFRVHSIHNYEDKTQSNLIRSAGLFYQEYGPGTKSNGWGVLSVARNRGNAAHGMVGVYGQQIRDSSAAAGGWGGVFESRDKTNEPNKPGIGIEVDIFGTGADDNNQRIGAYIVSGNGTTDRSQPTGMIGSGIQMGPANGDDQVGQFVRGINLLGVYQVGLDFQGHYQKAGVRFTNSGTKFSFDSYDSRYIQYQNGYTGYYVPGGGVGWQVFDKGGLRVPQLPADPGEGHSGEVYFNTSLKKFRGYNGERWRSFAFE